MHRSAASLNHRTNNKMAQKRSPAARRPEHVKYFTSRKRSRLQSAFLLIGLVAFLLVLPPTYHSKYLPLPPIPSSESTIISYTLIKGMQIRNTFDPFYACKADKYTGPRIAVSPAFTAPGVLDFQTQITSSLKIMVVGDSVGIQLSQALQESMGAEIQDRHVVKYAWRKHEGVHLAMPVRGGGAAAGYRITGMFNYKQKDNTFQLPPVPGGGWMQEHVNMLKEAMFNSTLTRTRTQTLKSGTKPMKGAVASTRVDAHSSDFDVAILQIPYGWLERPKEEKINSVSLQEALSTSHRVFGAKTVIMQTVPMQNNFENLHQEFLNVNQAISDFVNAYIPPEDGSGVQSVILMDLSFLSMNLFVHNAVGLNMVPAAALNVLKEPISFREKEVLLVNYLNATLEKRLNCCHPEYKEVVAFSCGVHVADPNSTKYCQRNIYSMDGMHWCMVSFVMRILHGLNRICPFCS